MEVAMSLSLNQLKPLIEQSKLLDQVEAVLRKAGKKETADNLLHLQQDAGSDAETAFGNFEDIAGTKTARLDADYKEVTAERFNGTLQDAHAALPKGDLRDTFQTLINKLYIRGPQQNQQQGRLHNAPP
jgi:hypothetical protein